MSSVLEEDYFGEKLGYRSFYQLNTIEHHKECLVTNISNADNTGLRLYFGSHVAIRLLESLNFLLEGKRVVEIGAGIGALSVLGCISANPSLLVVTDGESRAIVQIRQNLELYAGEIANLREISHAAEYKWSNVEQLNKVLEMCRMSDPLGCFDVVLGCELAYFSTSPDELVDTVLGLVRGDGLFIHAHAFRKCGQELNLIAAFEKRDWKTVQIPHLDFISQTEMSVNNMWWKVRPLVSGSSHRIKLLMEKFPSWSYFVEEISYGSEGLVNENADEISLGNLFL